MGEYAALAISGQIGCSWDDAMEILYGEPRAAIPPERRCPICQKSFKKSDAVIQHVEGFHRKDGKFRQAAHQDKYDAWHAAILSRAADIEKETP